MAALLRVVRWGVTLAAALLVGLGTATDGCDDDEAPALERCTSFLGNATYDWSLLPPAVLAIVVGVAVYAATGRLGRFWRTYAPLRD